MRGRLLKHVIISAVAVCTTILLSACGPATIGGEFTEPAYGWQRNGTYILTPAEMEMGCDSLRVEQGKAAKAIAYVDSVRGQKFGQSLMISGVAAMFGMVRLPNMGFEEQKAQEQLRQGANAFNVRLQDKGCELTDIDGLISEAKREFREERMAEERAAEAAAQAPASTQSFNKKDDDVADSAEPVELEQE
ncbi:hypothetical protein N9M21_04280 [Alphaproteobacteria bacterium]|nr:hypothetical protein [Alphaproteobacteria bacterium]